MTANAPRSSLSAGLRRHAPILLLAACVLLASAFELAPALRYERAAVVDGEWWRLLTAHLVHLGQAHLWLNLTGLALVWLLFGPCLSLPAWGLTLLLSALGTGLGLYWFSPALAWYVGLSGVLHGLFVAGALAELCVERRSGAVLLALLGMKLAWEQVFGATPGTAQMIGGAVVVDAHLYGAASGLLAFVSVQLVRFRRKKT